jgi:hypothetical protein
MSDSMSISTSIHFDPHSPIKVSRHRNTGVIVVALGDYPAQAYLFFENDAAYLSFYAAMQTFFGAEAIAEVV